MAETLLSHYWGQLADAWHIPDELSGPELVNIQEAYSQPQRYYHNTTHIEAMLRSFRQYSKEIADETAVLAAICYHDIVYEVPGAENEHRSAARAETFLKSVPVDAAKIDKIKLFIAATKQHLSNGDSDLDYLLDFDLQILAAPLPEYLWYAENIRKEYSIYPDALYRPGRQKVLQHFLEQEHIFKTPVFREQYEKQARHNLAGELAMLQ
jgi:predicted metal-dependent HD superfamily phosphohydrolase